MIIEHALLPVAPGEEEAFEEAMRQALPIIESAAVTVQASNGKLKTPQRFCCSFVGNPLKHTWESFETLKYFSSGDRSRTIFM